MRKRERALETARKIKNAGVNLDDLIEMLEEIDKAEKEEIGDEDLITEIMHESGITANLLGYKYLVETIKLTSNNPSRIWLHREVYPTIAVKFKVSPESVERAIRQAIKSTWEDNVDFYKKIIGEKALRSMKGPTNSVVIAAISQYYCSKKNI